MSHLGRAGGGGSSGYSGGDSGYSSYGGYESSSYSSAPADPIWALIGIIIAVLIVVPVIKSAIREDRAMKKDLKDANKKAAEKEKAMRGKSDSYAKKYISYDTARNIFAAYQKSWSEMDMSAVKKIATPKYADHAGLMLEALKEMGRQNIMESFNIHEIVITKASDTEAEILYKVDGVKDILLDHGEVVKTDTDPFWEVWRFVRQDSQDKDGWKLNEILQYRDWVYNQQGLRRLEKFAQKRGMHYSKDWGNLLTPVRGQIFSGKLSADVNDHVIGRWKGVLPQMYSYSKAETESDIYYFVGQISVPKNYGGILIKKASTGRFGKLLNAISTAPKGYKKITLEWREFNDRYRVYATDEEKVRTFELLNPSFMAWMYDQNLNLTLEVVDNVIYFYLPLSEFKEVPVEKYETMLEILRRAHKELKM